MKLSLISPSFLLIALVAFALPFCDLRCNKLAIARINGYDFIVGKDLSGIRDLKNPLLGGADEPTEEPASTNKERVKPNPFAITALLCALAGLIVSFALRNRRGLVIILVLSAIGAACLLLLKISAERHLQHKIAEGLDTDKLGSMGFYLEFLYGYFLAVIGFVGALIGGLIAWRESDTVRDIPQTPPPATT